MTLTNKLFQHLSEKDIEDYLWENPQCITIGSSFHIPYWLGRQVKVPSGIIDLLGLAYCDERDIQQLVVVELKKDKITPCALTQVCRYTVDIEKAMYKVWGRETENKVPMGSWSYINKVVITPFDVSDQIIFEANALDVRVQTLYINISMSSHSHWQWKSEHMERISNQIEELSKLEIFDCVVEDAQVSVEKQELIESGELEAING